MNPNNEKEVAGKQKTVSINRTFDLPLATVWKAWTDAESFKKWWGPTDYFCTKCTIDFKADGKYLANMKGPDGKETWSTGVFEKIVPMKKIVYTASFSDDKGNVIPASAIGMPGEWNLELLITADFEEINGKTKLSLTQESIPEEMYDDCIKGWQQSFDKLEKNFK